ncbi:MAG: hypothetical protein CML86_07495 [Rhodobiaceae bacterium]|nr:hypothetical protein [Rhodobiaceae bacterium]|tara:strand:+ start:3179 stop:3373 length:195 start_codon:yes stop_codon:yes gene_type:complete
MTMFTKYSIREIETLRTVVKSQHMKHYPKEMVTNYEADRIIESLSEQAREKLYELAVNYGITKL